MYLNNPTATNPAEDHEQTWGGRLQDWLDGDLGEAESGAVDTHVADCTMCQAQLARFEALDHALLGAVPRPSLSAGFDAQLLHGLDAMDEQQRARSRQRLEQEMQATLLTVSRRWRQALALLISGAIGGISLMLAVLSWLSDAGLSQALARQSADALGQNAVLPVQLTITALIGGAVGLTLARWLSTSAD